MGLFAKLRDVLFRPTKQGETKYIGRTNLKNQVGCKAIPLVWEKKDKVTGETNDKEVSVYGFFYNQDKGQIYGIRHWQAWEDAGYSYIQLRFLKLNPKFSYQEMGLRASVHQIEYKGGPTVIVVGWVYVPNKGECAIVWDDKRGVFKTMRADRLIDTVDPQTYYS